MRLSGRALRVLGVFAGLAGLATPARADVSARVLLDVLARRAPPAQVGPTQRAGPFGSNAPMSVLIELPSGVDARAEGLVAVAPGFAALEAPPHEIAALLHAHPNWPATWAPPRRPLLDRAAGWVRAPHVNGGSIRGRGVIIGIIDTGIDPSHPDLRDETGKSRVAWLLDVSRNPEQRHPELETEYGCTKGGSECAIFAGADLDELIGNQVSGDEPADKFGHGTHVASLALGNGLAGLGPGEPPKYVGVAPEATLIAARVSRGNDGAIFDSDILRATRFVFEQAERLGMPAVVNLSLGSEYGGHDGTAALERGLAAFVGPDHPGRSIVVAAGNSGGVYHGISSNYPSPFGTHTELHVPRASSVRVPLLSPKIEKATTEGRIFVWIALRNGDALDVGVEDEDGVLVDPLEPGDAGSFDQGDYDVTVINGTADQNSPIAPGTSGAVIQFDGKWETAKVFAIRLEGHGSARLWVQSEGDIGGGTNPDALFPRATKEGTINIPATHPMLIAAGASVNRTTWLAHTGKHTIEEDRFGSEDSMAVFSSAGPTASGLMKPDIVAPGAFVAGAMSKPVDPRTNGGQGMFAAWRGTCPLEPDGSPVQCFAVDAWHGITVGTSMAAPLVSGAVALLFERDPTLTQPEVITLLQAGTRRPEGAVPVEQQLGPGALDIERSLEIQIGYSPLDREPSPERSWISLASSFAHPDATWPVVGVIELRDADGEQADLGDPSRLRLSATPAIVVEPLARVAPGLWRFAVAAPEGTGGQRMQLRVLLDDEPLLSRELGIAVDRFVAEEGFAARGGCSSAPPAPSAASWWWLAAVAGAFGCRRLPVTRRG
jgi:subtilisin family serine protease